MSGGAPDLNAAGPGFNACPSPANSFSIGRCWKNTFAWDPGKPLPVRVEHMDLDGMRVLLYCRMKEQCFPPFPLQNPGFLWRPNLELVPEAVKPKVGIVCIEPLQPSCGKDPDVWECRNLFVGPFSPNLERRGTWQSSLEESEIPWGALWGT